MIVIDDFIKDQDLLNRLKQDNTFWDDKGYYWWNGWWNTPANTLKKELIEYIWGENSPYPSVSVSGFEYWTGVYSQDEDRDELPFHFDKDEYIWDTEKRIVSPVIGTVFYPWENDIDGGYLEIYPHGQDGEPERLEPKYNRLVIFPAGQHPHRVTKVTRGTRRAIAINLWDTEPSGVKNGEMYLEN
tara:strand:- start:308 stop:865 length:558 start_codon:yes stop_codon:yes gene_type:complete